MKTTVIVPTFNEGANAHDLVTRIAAATAGRDVEVVFVDDGDDDLPEVVAGVAGRIPFPARVIRRTTPTGRLGGAVVDGIRRSESDVVVVCDGDLQHPPEVIPALIDEAARADVVVATRYRTGGDPGGLDGSLRRLVSRASGALSRAVLPGRIRACSDPMSGFFAVRRSALDVDLLRPRGFKILLEILVRMRPARISEVPFVFGARAAGESHAGAAEGVRFLLQLVSLRAASSPTAARALRFAAVGASGVVPNLVALWLLERAGTGYLLAAALAVQVSICWNFVGAELLVWRRRAGSRPAHHRFLVFALLGETDLLRLPLVVLLVEVVAMPSLVATVLTILAAFLLRFLLADRVVYRAPRLPAAALPAAPLPAVAEPAP